MPNEPESELLRNLLAGTAAPLPATEHAAEVAVDAVLPTIRNLLAQTFVAGMQYGVEIAARAT